MAIRCIQCGRGYDVALFQFGRTIHCACGARVGRSVGPVRERGDGEPRFVADVMLGRLARWLRVLGYDTAYHPDAEDEALVRQAVREDRVLLTRDRRLPEEWWTEAVFVLRADSPLEQLREVVEGMGLGQTRPRFTRCTVCNAPLELVDPETVRECVPERVQREQGCFARCPGCARIYWEGSHTARMRRRLAALFGAPTRGAATRKRS